MGNYFRSNNTVDKKLQVSDNCDVTIFVSTKNIDSGEKLDENSDENSSDGVVVENSYKTPSLDTSNSSTKLNNLRHYSPIEDENLNGDLPPSNIAVNTKEIVEPVEPIVENYIPGSATPEPVVVEKQLGDNGQQQRGGHDIQSVTTDKEDVTKRPKRRRRGAKR